MDRRQKQRGGEERRQDNSYRDMEEHLAELEEEARKWKAPPPGANVEDEMPDPHQSHARKPSSRGKRRTLKAPSFPESRPGPDPLGSSNPRRPEPFDFGYTRLPDEYEVPSEPESEYPPPKLIDYPGHAGKSRKNKYSGGSDMVNEYTADETGSNAPNKGHSSSLHIH